MPCADREERETACGFADESLLVALSRRSGHVGILRGSGTGPRDSRSMSTFRRRVVVMRGTRRWPALVALGSERALRLPGLKRRRRET